jgi:glutaredoxin
VTQVVLFSRRRCHLCEAARGSLEAAGIAFAEVDIDTDPVLRAEYGTSVPVVEVAGVPVFEGGMDPSTVGARVREGREEARARDRSERADGRR